MLGFANGGGGGGGGGGVGSICSSRLGSQHLCSAIEKNYFHHPSLCLYSLAKETWTCTCSISFFF